MRATRRQKIINGALGGIAAIVLVTALVLQGKGLRLWISKSLGLPSEIAAPGPPAINAVVQAVQPDGGPGERLVVLSVGTDQKVREGFLFTICRGQKVVGKAQVIKVHDDLCGAGVFFTERGESIRVGDQAIGFQLGLE